jgi:hypothetical protein
MVEQVGDDVSYAEKRNAFLTIYKETCGVTWITPGIITLIPKIK